MIEFTKRHSRFKSSLSFQSRHAFLLIGLFVVGLLCLRGSTSVFAEELDSADPSPWAVAYFSRIQMDVEESWLYPKSAIERKEAGQVTVRLVISKEGGLLAVSIAESSSFPELDEAAKDAVSKAAPFDPFPPSLKKDFVAIKMNFSYLPE